MITITLRRIMECGLCYNPIDRGVFDKDHDFDEPISFRWLAKRIPQGDVIWCFANLPGEHNALKRHFAVDCAERVRHLMTDERSLNALAVARKHALGEASDAELRVARDAALAACETARATARGAAWTAVCEAAWAACEAAWATCETAWSACETARATASNAAWAAACDAVWAAACETARTARATAWDAARGAAWDAARGAAWDAELRWQVRRIIELTEAGEWSPAGGKK